jgi:toxin ParE1/3/4
LNCIISDPANQDLETIADYLGANYGLATSEKFIDGITARFRYIAQFPRIGRTRNEIATGLRSLHYEQYIILYKIEEPTIEIVRVASGYQDLKKLFEEDDDD